MMRITKLTLIGCIALGANGCERPFLESTTVPDPPNDTAGCSPDAGVEALATNATVEGIELSWQSAATNADGFVIERRDAGTGTWGEIARIDDESFEHLDAAIVVDHAYAYRARSYRVVEGQDCLSEVTGEVEQTSLAGPLTSLAARSLTPTSVELTWVDDNVTTLAYRVQRRILNQDFAEVGGVVAPAQSYTDIGLTPGLTYDYRVLIVNAGGAVDGGEASIFAWEPPELTWDEPPTLDLACYVTLPGSVTYAPTAEAAFDHADGTIDKVDDVLASEVGIEGLLTDKTAGPFQASWTVTDNFDVSTNEVRNFELQRETITITPPRLPRGVGEDVGVSGLQLMYPGCADCLGHRGSIAAGTNHTCAATAAGSAVCWGGDDTGNLHGAPESTRIPALVVAGDVYDPYGSPLVTPYVPVAGGDHACVLTSAGEAMCWGQNDYGELGDGTNATRSYPVGVCESGAGYACPKLSNITQIAAGRDHTCAVLASGEARCWGKNIMGHLGVGYVLGNAALPQVVCASGGALASDCAPLTGVESIALGENHTCATLDSGELRCWGSNASKKLGRDPPATVINPAPVCSDSSCLATHTAASVAGGLRHRCSVQASGEMQCWGRAQYGPLGGGLGAEAAALERSAPTPVCATGRIGADCQPLTGATRAALGQSHSCAIVAGGEVRCWGHNGEGQLGSGEEMATYVKPPAAYRVCLSGVESAGDCDPLTDVVDLASAYDSTCAITASGAGYCWGDNGSRQLGLGNNWTDQTNAVPICANGTLWTGEICEDGTGTDTRMTGLTAVAVGDLHTCAIGAGGTVYCWGDNSTGYPVIGDGTGTDRYTPVPACLTGTGDGVDCAGGTPFTGATQIVAHDRHTCVLVGADAWCWGDGDSGRLGMGKTSPDPLNPAMVCETGIWDDVSACAGGNQLTGVRMLAAGEKHTCAVIDATGEVKCWGDNYYGQLGNGESVTDQPNPVTVCASGSSGGGTCVPLTGVRSISASQFATCAVIDATDEVFCWGQNDLATIPLGVSVGPDSGTPVPVCASGWGRSCVPWVGAPISIHATDEASCVVTDASEAFCWGDGFYGALGGGEHGTSAYDRGMPGPVCETGIWDGTDCTGNRLSGITALDGGDDFFCALVGDVVKCWGYAATGRLGNESVSPNQPNPVDVCHPDGCASGSLSPVVSVSAGNTHACAVTAGGEAYCWGHRFGGATVVNAILPEPVCNAYTPDPVDPTVEICDPITDASQVAVGQDFACLRMLNGETRCWGDNRFGSLGAFASNWQANPSAVCARGFGNDCERQTGLVSVTAGGRHTCALTEAGTALCWGDNFSGELGIGLDVLPVVNQFRLQPQEVCASGQNDGDGCFDEGQPSPLSDLLAVAAGRYHTCVLTSDGAVKCWGWNGWGQVGIGSISPAQVLLPEYVVCSGSPVPSTGCSGPGPQSEVVGLAGGWLHTCALLSDATVRCWGGNDNGQLGVGDFVERATPEPVDLGSARVMAVAAGREHTCAILEDGGRVACWGQNLNGQLGVGNVRVFNPQEPAPRLVCASGTGVTCEPLTGAKAIAAGDVSTCVIAEDPDSADDPPGNRLLCWGWNEFNVLGDGRYYPGTDDAMAVNPVEVCAPEEPSTCQECRPDEDPACIVGSSCAQKLTDVVAIAIGSRHACALTGDQGTYCWGEGIGGKRGDGLGAPTAEGEHCTARPVCDVATGACGDTDHFQNAALQTCDLIRLVEP